LGLFVPFFGLFFFFPLLGLLELVFFLVGDDATDVVTIETFPSFVSFVLMMSLLAVAMVASVCLEAPPKANTAAPADMSMATR
jgi:hypothetical protein